MLALNFTTLKEMTDGPVHGGFMKSQCSEYFGKYLCSQLIPKDSVKRLYDRLF